MLDTLKELLGLDTAFETRTGDVAVSVERDPSLESDDISRGSESTPETETLENDRPGKKESSQENGQFINKSKPPSSPGSETKHTPEEIDNDEPVEGMEEGSNHNNLSTKISVSTSEFAELSGFKRDLLIVVGGLETPKGLEILDELEKYYDETVNHGRLYPNLDDLVESGYIDKISLNERSNGYNLTDEGKELVERRQHWETQKATQLEEMDPKSSEKSTGGFNFNHENSERQPTTEKLVRISEVDEGQRLEELVIKVVAIDDDERPKRDVDLRVEDVSGDQFPFAIWTKHSMSASWTEETWYWLHESRVQVWNNSSGPKRNISSTKDLVVEELGKDLDWNTIDVLRKEYNVDADEIFSAFEPSNSPSDDQKRHDSSGSDKSDNVGNESQGTSKDNDKVNKLLEDLNLE